MLVRMQVAAFALAALGLLAPPALGEEPGIPASRYDAKGLHEAHSMLDAVLDRCTAETGDASTYEDAKIEWLARNFYVLDLADIVLAWWQDSYDPAELLPSRVKKVDTLFESYGTQGVCTQYVAAIMDGSMDVDVIAPEASEKIYASDRAITELKRVGQ